MDFNQFENAELDDGLKKAFRLKIVKNENSRVTFKYVATGCS